MTKRVGRFQPGQSGNPGGRPKENAEVRDLARQYTEEAIERLAFWMQSDNAKATVSACQAILSRGWGTPMQAVELTGKDGESLEATNTRDLARTILHVLNSAQLEDLPSVH